MPCTALVSLTKSTRTDRDVRLLETRSVYRCHRVGSYLTVIDIEYQFPVSFLKLLANKLNRGEAKNLMQKAKLNFLLVVFVEIEVCFLHLIPFNK